MSAPVGAYRWRYEADWIDGLDAGSWVSYWDPTADPVCEGCADFGSWVDPDGEVVDCPICYGDSRDRQLSR